VVGAFLRWLATLVFPHDNKFVITQLCDLPLEVVVNNFGILRSCKGSDDSNLYY
jgi:hypothetical protein